MAQNRGANNEAPAPKAMAVDSALVRELAELLAETGWPEAVIKPCVSGGARHTYRVDRANAAAVQRVIAGGAAGSWALTNLAPRALDGDVAPGFLVRHLLKDLALARQCAAETGIDLPGLETAERLYRLVADRGDGDAGTQALYRRYAGG